MRKKRLHIKIGLLALFNVYTEYVHAQALITLPPTSIQNGTDYNQEFSIGNYNSTLALIPTVRFKAINSNFSNTAGTQTVPFTATRIKLAHLGTLSLIGLPIAEVTPQQGTYQQLYVAVANLTSGPARANIRILTSSQVWFAGSYNSDMDFTAISLLGINNALSPSKTTVTLEVQPFINPIAAIGTTSLLVNNLSYFRAVNGISANKTVLLTTTVPYIPSLKATSNQFIFSTSLAYNTPPISPVSDIAVTLSATAAATITPITSLSTTEQALTTTNGVTLSTNNQSLTNTFSINGDKLKNHFVQAGKYDIPLIYSWKEAPSNPSAQNQVTETLEIVVSDLSELILNPAQQAVNFAFTTADHYKNGISQDMPAHLKLSKTTPYNLYVRATSPSFNSGANTIPLDIMRIGPATGETGINTITLSATAQKLIDSANPVIDRNISIRYSIPASETSKLLNKPAGTYSSNIVFSFTAP